MLVLSRKANESIIIGENVEIEVLEIRGRFVRLGIKAPREVHVVRLELFQKHAVDAAELVGASSAP